MEKKLYEHDSDKESIGGVLGVVSEMFASLEKEWEMVLETQIRATFWRTEDNKEVRSSRKPMNQ